MLEMMAEIQDVQTMFRRKSLRETMFRKMLGMYREFFELLLQDLLQIGLLLSLGSSLTDTIAVWRTCFGSGLSASGLPESVAVCQDFTASGDAARAVPVPETFHEQTNDELMEAEIKHMEADDQAIQTILLALPEDIYAAVDSCETAQEIWLRLMNDFKRNKHFPEKIASNLMFLNNLQPEWSRHVTIVHQTKDLHTTNYTQLYDFLKYNQKEIDDLRTERLAKTHDPLALMANSNNPFNYPMFHQDQPSPSTYMQQPKPINNNYNPQPSFNQNYMQQPMPNPEDITDPTTAMNMALIAQLVQNPGGQNVGNQNKVIVVSGIANQNRNGNVVAARAEGNANGTNDGSAEVQLHDNCYNDEIFNMFTQEEQYTELLEPIPEPHKVPQNDSNVISEVSSVE
ncbi:hypothetical protein Tco_0394839 [Tanacetum coccineum]